MIQYVIAGLVLGGIYAIASAGLVVTYRATGILNFSFGALAYFIARFYYYLHVQHGWAIAPAAVVAILVAGPCLGIVLYFALFRMLRLSSTLLKVVVTLGVAICIPPLSSLLFGDVVIVKAPGLAPEPVHVYQVLGVPVTLDQIIVYICVVAIGVLGVLILRFTDVGLRVRAMVDSPAMTALSGTSPTSISVGVWAVSVFLAGLSGVLSAPTIGLDPKDYTLLMASAFAAVVAARLRNLSTAVVVGLIIGVAGALVQYYLPSDSSFTAAVIPSIPFVVMAIFLIYNMIRWGAVDEAEGVGGALDRAIAPQGAESMSAGASSRRASEVLAGIKWLGWLPTMGILSVLVLLLFTMSSFWVSLMAMGVAYAIIFLSITLVTGEGGMIWLCQVTFAGVGAIAAAQLATKHGWPVIVAVLVGGLVAVPIGAIIGVLTIRLGDVYVALVTLTVGLLMDNLVFSRQTFLNNGIGVEIARPNFASSDQGVALAGLVVFCIIGLIIANLRKSTTGLALGAVRWSEPAAKTVGISVLQMKLIVSCTAAFVAGLGGAILAVVNGAALPDNYNTLVGVTWLAVLVTAGIRSNAAALIAGLLLTIVPGLVTVYLADHSSVWNQIPPILFGLGAIGLAKNPEGFVTQNGRALGALIVATGRRLRVSVSGRTDAPDDPPHSDRAPERSQKVPS